MNGGEVVFHFKGDDKDLDKKTSELGSKLGNIGKSVGGAFLKGTAVATTAITGLVGASVKMYADVEQSVGGVETLFKDSADTVIANAKRAYKTAGMSANEYMENVTSFSASLLQSLSGDTKKASEYADRAMVDMSDNANKMGTSMEMIQNAYQGFAKQNYTMLDNLKLGYGGTKEEMARLIKDASKMTDIQKELNISVKDGDMSFGNIVNAISVMQKKLDIAGTTAKEASTTISGSIGSAKSAFENFLAGTGGVNEVIRTFTTAGTNIMNAIIKMAPKVIDGLIQMINALIPQIPPLIEKLLPTIINGINGLINGLVSAFPAIIQALTKILPQILTTLTTMLPNILQEIINIIPVIATALSENLPTLIPVLVQGIISLMQVFNNNMPLFMKAGVQIIVGLIKGLINSLPLILQNLGTIIEFIINFFTVAKLVGAGKTLLTGLGKGLINGVPSLLQKIPQIIGNMINIFKTSGISGFKEVGSMLIRGLWSGIGNMGTWVISKIKGLGKSILKSVKGIFGVHSPSREFAWIGKMNMVGLENGMEDMQPKVQQAIDGMFDLSPSLYGSASTNLSPQVNVINNINMKQDPLGQMVNDVKTFSGGAKNDYNYGMA